MASHRARAPARCELSREPPNNVVGASEGPQSPHANARVQTIRPRRREVVDGQIPELRVRLLLISREQVHIPAAIRYLIDPPRRVDAVRQGDEENPQDAISRTDN